MRCWMRKADRQADTSAARAECAACVEPAAAENASNTARMVVMSNVFSWSSLTCSRGGTRARHREHPPVLSWEVNCTAPHHPACRVLQPRGIITEPATEGRNPMEALGLWVHALGCHVAALVTRTHSIVVHRIGQSCTALTRCS